MSAPTSKTTGVNWVNEGLASVVVFLVALPLCMGIAIASGVPPTMGLISGIIGGLVVGSLAGSPIQVSGPAAGLAVIVYEAVQTHGLATLGPILVIAGLIQVAAGRLKVGQWFRAVSPAVIYAMLAGIGVLIFGSQFHVMVDDAPPGNGLTNLVTIPSAIMKGVPSGEPTAHHYAAGIGVLTIFVLVVWNAVRKKLPAALAVLPAPLLAVIVAVAAAAGLELPIAYVDMPESAAGMLTFPDGSAWAMLAKPAVLATAVAVAVIASAEALLCAMAVDKIHDGTRSDLDQELFAQGVGNTLAGFVGGLPITGVIVRSTANVESGAQTRWSAVMHGVWLVLAVVAIPFVLEMVPVSALAAILVYIGYRLVDRQVPKRLLERGKGELAIYLVTVGAIVATNLLEGLMIGIVLSLLKLAWSVSHLEVTVSEAEIPDNRLDVVLKGSGTFVGLPILARELEALQPGKEVHIHVDQVDYLDHACLEAISEWRVQYEQAGGAVSLEWAKLATRGTAISKRPKTQGPGNDVAAA